MKQIKLIKTKVTNTALNKQQPDFELDYKTEFLRLVEIMPDGIQASQMGTAIKVAGKLINTPPGEFLILEDAEMDYLRDRLKAARFQFTAPEVVAMVEAVENAETVTAPHLKSEKASG